MNNYPFPANWNPTGIGVDVVEVSRFAAKLDSSRFHERLFSVRELEAVSDGPTRAERLAARWAAKEATAKALGCGFGEKFTWKDLEILKDDDGRPYIRFSDRANERFSNPEALLSISHDGGMAIAFVVIKQNQT